MRLGRISRKTNLARLLAASNTDTPARINPSRSFTTTTLLSSGSVSPVEVVSSTSPFDLRCFDSVATNTGSARMSTIVLVMVMQRTSRSVEESVVNNVHTEAPVFHPALSQVDRKGAKLIA
ncbi:hypothetical protein PsorP6_009276 [Peronosclerospora sorghi]|uniref:Uncharacterized protein n=1 Tax=Peronosclerospora sorghi TaxID=230839 RepID=A0ACC0W0A2_9STRA|nr:hypothetical protein PsorP6_009276 [Peronosclerospora sorghi]